MSGRSILLAVLGSHTVGALYINCDKFFNDWLSTTLLNFDIDSSYLFLSYNGNRIRNKTIHMISHIMLEAMLTTFRGLEYQLFNDERADLRSFKALGNKLLQAIGLLFARKSYSLKNALIFYLHAGAILLQMSFTLSHCPTIRSEPYGCGVSALENDRFTIELAGCSTSASSFG